MLKTFSTIEKMRAYRARLVKAGRLLEARAVERCIEIFKQQKMRPAQGNPESTL